MFEMSAFGGEILLCEDGFKKRLHFGSDILKSMTSKPRVISLNSKSSHQGSPIIMIAVICLREF